MQTNIRVEKHAATEILTWDGWATTLPEQALFLPPLGRQTSAPLLATPGPLLREHIARTDDARALLRQIFDTEADLIPDLAANTLTVRLHHFTQAAHDQAIEQLLTEINATQTIFPGTRLTLIFEIGSS